jgi:hypothetical protein
MSGKLTDAQMRVLRTLGIPSRYAWSASALGTQTCEALRKRGLVSSERNKPFDSWNSHAFVRLTDAGRSALRPTPSSPEPREK